VFGGASRSASEGMPVDDGLFMSCVETLRNLKPSEYPLAQPYRLKVITATATTKVEDYVKDMPVEKFQKEELQLLNGLYPNREPRAGDSLKVVE
jgi:predicted Zn-dependent protease